MLASALWCGRARERTHILVGHLLFHLKGLGFGEERIRPRQRICLFEAEHIFLPLL
jgi:hypothetical protein